MKVDSYDFTTATAVCNDVIKNTWEVRAMLGANPSPFVVSDSTQMSEHEARELAKDMREQAKELS